MKIFFAFLISLLLFSTTLYCAELTCSSNGAKVFYINGVLTKESKNGKDTESIFNVFKQGNEFSRLDSNQKKLEKSDFIGIHNPSYGFINDAAELFAQQYYIKNGNNKNALAIYYALRKAPDLFVKAASKFIPIPPVAIAAGLIPTTGLINFASLEVIAEESTTEALKSATTDVDDLMIANEVLINKVRLAFRNAQMKKKKMLIVAHSQGNTALLATLKKIELENTDLNDYLKKYSGLMHVASPVMPNPNYKNNSIRYSGDLVIGLLGSFENILPISPAPLTHVIEAKADSDPTGHLFYDTYLSDSILVRKIAGGNLEPSQQVFKENMFNLAEKIDDNCNSPEIKILAPSATEISKHVFKIQSAGQSAKSSINVVDLNNESGTTIFTISYNDYRYDINTYPFNIFTQTTIEGTSASIPIPFAGAAYSVSVSAYNPETKKSASASATFSATTDVMPTINHVVNCFKGMYSNGNTFNTGSGEVRVGASDSDSSILYIGVWYPNQETGAYDGNFTDNAYRSPFGYFYGFENFFFNEREYVYSVDFAGRNDIRIIYENSNGKVGYVSVINSCKNY